MLVLLFTYIERNFRKKKGTPYCPTLFCLEKTGPLEVSFIVSAITRSKGEKSTSAIRLPVISIARFMRGTCSSAVRDRRGNQAGLPDAAIVPPSRMGCQGE